MLFSETLTYSVSQLNHYLKDLLEQDEGLQDITVEGEIGQFTRSQAGHCYFTIKDEDCQIPCVMFRNRQMAAAASNYRQGDQVVLRGSISLYPQGGKLQFIATQIRRSGEGNLFRQFIELKERLQQEGLFAEERKRPLPYFPQKIGVATSPTGAVIHDIIRTLRNKCPHVEVVLFPIAVQGDNVPRDVCFALNTFNKLPDIDLVIVARGGGSFEELFGFNDEAVARAIFNSKIPVVSAIGHESDYTIADFVADHRAATPTAAAELVVPDAADLQQELLAHQNYLLRKIDRELCDVKQQLDDEQRTQMYHAQRVLGQKRSEVNLLTAQIRPFRITEQLKVEWQKLQNLTEKKFTNHRKELDRLRHKLELRDISKTLQRGFSITMKAGKVIRSTENLQAGDELETILHSGKATSVVKEKQDDKKES